MSVSLPSMSYFSFNPSQLTIDLSSMQAIIDSLTFDVEFANIDLSGSSFGATLDMLAPLLGYSSGSDVLTQVSKVVNDLINTVFGITDHKLHISLSGTDISSLLDITAAQALFEMV